MLKPQTRTDTVKHVAPSGGTSITLARGANIKTPSHQRCLLGLPAGKCASVEPLRQRIKLTCDFLPPTQTIGIKSTARHSR
ncbi:hypothetical protein KCP78_22985 [Salmonella enterica subsp. enterica]|nr:hypothetical protein KCP78_22985 [Salmonella enterica subsp. enterica]